MISPRNPNPTLEHFIRLMLEKAFAMTEVAATLIDQLKSACEENLAGVTQALNSSLGSQFSVSISGPEGGREQALQNAPDSPGIAVVFEFDGQGLLVLLPEHSVFRDWYRTPDETQSSRLQTLAMEWSVALFPPEIEVGRFETVPTPSLREQLLASEPGEDAKYLRFSLSDASNAAEVTSMLLIPVSSPRFEPAAHWPAPAATVTEDLTNSFEEIETDDSTETSETPRKKRLNPRLLSIPVPLIVQIASKKIDLAQLRTFSSGTLLTFGKPAEELLDVYIGNRLYCRGEAVKVGENFGVKINEVEARVIREKRVHHI